MMLRRRQEVTRTVQEYIRLGASADVMEDKKAAEKMRSHGRIKK